MPINVLVAGRPENWPTYQKALSQACAAAGLDVLLSNNADTPERFDYIVYDPNGPVRDFTPFVNLKAVLSLWAGVESFASNSTLTTPLTRMVDSGLREGMVEYVTGHTLRHHLGMDQHITQQDGIWRNHIVPPLARNRRVSILGLGALGRACAEALVSLNFNVSGWCRTLKDVSGVACYEGPDGLRAALSRADILVLLLPLTTATENTLNAETLALLPKGAVIINPGRGALIDDDALLAALDSNHIAQATLDVFRTEPLPADHLYWAHPNVTVTPHIASESRPETASAAIAENIRRGEAGESYLNLVDRTQGY